MTFIKFLLVSLLRITNKVANLERVPNRYDVQGSDTTMIHNAAVFGTAQTFVKHNYKGAIHTIALYFWRLAQSIRR